MPSFILKKNVPFTTLTTFKIGGEAKYLAEVKNKEELKEAVAFAKKKDLPIFVLGGGSDILISDAGFDGVVVKYVGESVNFRQEGKSVDVTAAAGLTWDKLVANVVNKNLQGIECLSGIPGSVGASPIQNIGAYGQEIKDAFVSLSAYDIQKEEFVVLAKKDCGFSYRESIFKKPEAKGRYIITDITLKLKKGGEPLVAYESLKSYLKGKGIKNPTLSQIREAVLDLRGQRLEDPRVIGNAGSFFKNPIITKGEFSQIKKNYPQMPYHEVSGSKVKLFAGWLIENAGWRGRTYKNTKVSDKNALVIVNPEGKATAKEVRELAEKISDDVYQKFGVRLEPEVQYIGF
ncbi:MAG: UDP-N-acetylmuramate dehydrogenase [Patescibacteria group bacterium]